MDMLDESSEEESEDESSDDEPREKSKPVVVESSKNMAPEEAEEEDLDAILSSFHNESDAPLPQSAPVTPSLRSLLLAPSRGYDIQALDLDYAVRSLLGGVGNAANIEEEDINDQRRGGRGRGGGGRKRVAAKKYLFGRPKESWGKPPSYVGGGLGCKELNEEERTKERHSWSIPWPYCLGLTDESEETDANTDNKTSPAIIPKQQKWYTLTMSDTYQEQNYAYQQLLRSRNNRSPTLEDPNALAMFVADHPHFADTLLQLSMVLYHVNDRSKGNDLLRRTMYLYESALPGSILPNTNDSTGEVLMDIDRQPNSGMFATLFRIMQTSGMTGCFPNALMVGRFLLSLDPLRDPMGVLLILDYYALACRQSVLDGEEMGATFVKELVESGLVEVHYKDPLTDRHYWCGLRDMPGWAYSYALAFYRLARGEDAEEDMEGLADDALVDALTRFPSILPKLLTMNKVNTQDRSFRIDWPKVLPQFNAAEAAGEGESVEDRVAKGAGDHLVRIFVQRHHKLWAGDDVVQWLYRCAEKVVERNGAAEGEEKDTNDANQCPAEDDGDQQPASEAAHQKHRLTCEFSPALARYAQFDPSEYEDAFRTLPPEAIALDPNIIAPAMEFNPNRRGRFLRRGQVPDDDIPFRGGQEGLMRQLRDALGMVGEGGEMEMLDPDSPILQLYLQSLLPWNNVEGVRPPR